jgi:transposase InsO family protein
MTEGTQGIARGATILRLCALGQVSRAGYYRRLDERPDAAADTDLRSRIQAVCLDNRHYGYRRVTHALRRLDIEVNKKRVQRLMAQDNLLALRQRPFVPATTDSRHGLPVVPNLIRGLIPSRPDQIWVADITYIRLAETFVYLAVVLDACSRRAVGWALAGHIGAALAIEALDMAIAARPDNLEGLIHHSDRGVQYACRDYVGRLTAHGIVASMSRVGNPYDNARAESFMKTLKTEEVDGKTYLTIDDARRNIETFIEDTYNRKRLHSAIGYTTPVEFEATCAQTLKP